ncbi:MAG: HEPN domain-containing protein [Paludibacter sp.]
MKELNYESIVGRRKRERISFISCGAIKRNYLNGAINRLYYACYYIATALLIKNGISTQTHAGTKQMLGLHFVVNGKLSLKISNTYATLFEKRHSSDYDDFAYYDKDTVEKLYPQVDEFIHAIENLISL